MLEFRELTLEDKPQVDACARAHSYHLCEHCFTDLFIWRGHYQTKICFAEGFLLIQMQTAETGQVMYLAPVCDWTFGAGCSRTWHSLYHVFNCRRDEAPD